jgi:hypothetical protein
MVETALFHRNSSMKIASQLCHDLFAVAEVARHDEGAVKESCVHMGHVTLSLRR